MKKVIRLLGNVEGVFIVDETIVLGGVVAWHVKVWLWSFITIITAGRAYFSHRKMC